MLTLVVFSCDQKYFPLAKGLVLSLQGQGLKQAGIELAFIDIGCGEQSLEWLRQKGVTILPSSEVTAIDGLRSATGFQVAQVCRPYLPRLFPKADCFIWLDSDLWVQFADTIKLLASYAAEFRDKLFICPEWHYAYTPLNEDIVRFHVEHIGAYYRAAYGPEIAAKLSVRPTLNVGVFAMAATNPVWEMWAGELQRLWGRDFGNDDVGVRFMAEQLSLNYVAYRAACAVPVDPLFNFMGMWGSAFRGKDGLVRVPYPPYATIGIVHLSTWLARRAFYFESGLLFQQGRYLNDDERRLLLS